MKKTETGDQKTQSPVPFTSLNYTKYVFCTITCLCPFGIKYQPF